MMEKVTAAQPASFSFGDKGECIVSITKNQRWYIKYRSEGVICITRDNVEMEVLEDDFNRLFSNRVRLSKWE